jgi:hypothetical protein
MEIEFNTREKLLAFLSQTSRLLLSDFPHPSSESALERIKQFFHEQLDRLDRAARSTERKVLIQTCITINERIYQHLPILGFLLRSTNIRNYFEAYHAFVEMAKALIGPNAQVIMSSEWDFSPLTYPMTVGVLPEHVLIGMPSSESSNALILPLAGHELGHSIWRTEKLENKWAAEVRQSTRDQLKSRWTAFQSAFPEHSNLRPTDDVLSTNLFLVRVQSDVVDLSLSQIEEIFCDAIGIQLFGASFAYSFHYLLAPSIGGPRALEYPPLASRAEFLANFGNLDLKALGFSDYSSEFQDQQPNLAPRPGFVSTVADSITRTMAEQMYMEARRTVLSKANQFIPDDDASVTILRMFQHGIPSRMPRSLADILNAGWAYVKNAAPTFNDSERGLIESVSELMLKSIEVLEYRSRVNNA